MLMRPSFNLMRPSLSVLMRPSFNLMRPSLTVLMRPCLCKVKALMTLNNSGPRAKRIDK